MPNKSSPPVNLPLKSKAKFDADLQMVKSHIDPGRQRWFLMELINLLIQLWMLARAQGYMAGERATLLVWQQASKAYKQSRTGDRTPVWKNGKRIA